MWRKLPPAALQVIEDSVKKHGIYWFFLVLVFWFKLGILVYDKSLGCATSISRRAPGSGFISLQRHVKDPLTAGYWKICPFAKNTLKTYPVTVKINITLSSNIGPRTLNPFRRSFSWKFHYQNFQIFKLDRSDYKVDRYCSFRHLEIKWTQKLTSEYIIFKGLITRYNL